MLMLTLGGWVTGFLAFLFLLVCLAMALVILIQKPKGGGLAGAFGGGGSSGSAVFGAKTGDVLTWFTIGCFAAFILLSILLVLSIRSEAEAIPTFGVETTAETSVPTNIPPVPNPNDPTGGVPASQQSPITAPEAPAAKTDGAAPTPAPAAPAEPTTTPAPAAPAPDPAPAPRQ